MVIEELEFISSSSLAGRIKMDRERHIGKLTLSISLLFLKLLLTRVLLRMSLQKPPLKEVGMFIF